MTSIETSRFRLITLEELDDFPEPSWLIKGILPENELCVLFGLPGSMKTFIALSMALSIGAGHNWCGKTTKKGSVLYLAAEGLSGLRLRSQAYRRVHGINAADVRFMGEGLNLRNPDDLRQVRKCLENNDVRPNLIIIDTLARSIPGAEENSSRDMGEVICAVDELRRETSATALLVHHTGKDGEAERGSSALGGAAYAMIKCRIMPSDSQLVSLSCNKMKDAERFQPATVNLERVQITRTTSSLAVTNWRDHAETKVLHSDELLEILETQFPHGATNTELQRAFTQYTGKEEATFARTLRAAKEKGLIKKDGKKYYANRTIVDVGVKCQEVSEKCHDTSHDGVMSSPPLGDDTDTAAIGQK